MSFVSATVVARIVPPSAYGLMGMTQLVIGFAALFQDIGAAAAVVQRRKVTHQFLSTVWWANLVLACATSAVCWTVAPLAAAFYREPAMIPLLRAVCWSFVFGGLAAVHNALLNRRLQFKRMVAAELTGATVGLLAAIVLAVGGAGVWALVAGNLSSIAVNAALQIILARWLPSFTFSWSDLKSMSRFGLHLSAFNFVNYFARNADNVLIGRYLGAGPLGYYQMAYTFMLYPVQSVSGTLGRVLFPAFTKLQEDHERFRGAYLRACAAIAALTFPMMIGLAILSKEVVLVVLGPKWLPIVPLLQILAPIGALQSISTTMGQIYMATGRTDLMFRWGTIFSAITVGAFVAGLAWGIEGVALAYAAVFSIIVVPALKLAFALIGLRLGRLCRTLWPCLRCALLMGLSVVAFHKALVLLFGNQCVIVQLMTSVGFGGTVYIALMLYSQSVVLKDMIRLREMAKAAIAGLAGRRAANI